MKFLSNILIKAGLTVDGATQLNTITNATIDTDKFLVSDGGVVKYRTGAQVLSDIGAASANGYVPYIGATTNVDLGEFGISSGYFQADLTPSGSLQVGRMQWNSSDGTMDLRLMGNNVTLQIGQEQVARVVNGTGGNLLESNYQAVKIIGAQGQRLQVGLARADNDANSKDTLGLVTENINNNQEGFITVSGIVNEINTTGSLQGETWTDGDTLYLSGTTSGRITNIKPSAPIHTVIVGFVVYAHANHGKIFVKVDNGYELEELHDVAPTPYVNKGVLYRDTATNLWKSATIGTLLGYTPANAATTLTINGTAYDLSTNRTWNVGTVTSVGTSGPLTGGTITGSGTIGITQSSAASDGYLSNTDWATFNNKQTALNGTGFVKISGTTISYDNSTYYLASNPSAFIALTALSATAPLSYDNTTGVFSISQATTSTNGYLSSTDWNTFNNKQAAGSYITALTGEATASGPGSASVTLSTSAVTGKILTGLNLTGGGSIADTDSILQAFGKVQNQISGLAGGVTYQGTWNASTNTPTLTSSVGTKGYYYIVDVAGSTNLNGITDWKVGDWAIFNGSTWDKVDNTDAVSSVNGFTGAVSLTTSNIAEGTNLYYLDSRARLALSFTAGSGAYDNTTGVITIPTNTSQLTNGANFITLSSLSASSPLAYNSGTGAFSIQVANGSQNGYLSSTDWTTFNSKQPAGNYVTTDTVQTITALKTFTSKVTLNTGGTDNQLQIVGTAPSVRLTNAVTGATINGFIAMSGATDNYVQGSVSGDMCIGNQNNGKILFGFGSGTATQKLSLDSSGNVVLAGGLTLGSTLSNGTYTYTLPGATGTLALVGGAGVGTVTSVGLSSATSGVTIGSTPVTTSGTITLAIATASGSQQGLLSSTDWNTFNNKQNALTNPVTGSGTTNYLTKFTGTSTIGNSAITDDGTTVTLVSRALSGTSASFISTAKVLEVKQSAAGSATYYVFDNTIETTGKKWRFGYTGAVADAGTFSLYNETDNVVNFVAKGGNLGLGVTPSAWGSGYTAFQIENNGIMADGDRIWFYANGYFDGSSNRYLQNGFASRYYQANSSHVWETAPSGTAGNAISFTQAMTLDASGNLAIGTTSAVNSRLYVANSGVANLIIGYNNTSVNYYDANTHYFRNASATINLTLASTGAATFSSSVTTGGDVNIPNGNYYYAKRNTGGANINILGIASGTDTTTLKGGTSGSGVSIQFEDTGGPIAGFNNGRFGIGTTAPTTNLQVYQTGGAGNNYVEGTIQVGGVNSALGGAFSYAAQNSGYVNIVNLNNGGGANARISFGFGAITSGLPANNVMTINQSGNVGIGTTSPSNLLHLYGTDGNSYLRWTSDVATTGARIGYNGTEFRIDQQQNADVTIRTNGSERMRITSGGNVGIGISNPTGQLSIKNQIYVGSPSPISSYAATSGVNGQNFFNGYYADGSDGLGPYPRYFDIVSVGSPDGSNGGSNIRFFTNPVATNSPAVERLRITSGGNVEINTGSIKTGEPDTGYGRAAVKIGTRQSGTATDSGGYIPISIDGTVYFINLYTSTP